MRCYCVAIISLSYSLCNIEQGEIRKPWLFEKESESEWIEWLLLFANS